MTTLACKFLNSLATEKSVQTVDFRPGPSFGQAQAENATSQRVTELRSIVAPENTPDAELGEAAQRIPVRIILDASPPDAPFRMG